MDYSIFTCSFTGCIVLTNRYSSWFKVISGVPRGYVLGSMLFIVFINAIYDTTVNRVLTKLYADDLKLYTSLMSTDDSNYLQDVSLLTLTFAP